MAGEIVRTEGGDGKVTFPTYFCDDRVQCMCTSSEVFAKMFVKVIIRFFNYKLIIVAIVLLMQL